MAQWCQRLFSSMVYGEIWERLRLPGMSRLLSTLCIEPAHPRLATKQCNGFINGQKHIGRWQYWPLQVVATILITTAYVTPEVLCTIMYITDQEKQYLIRQIVEETMLLLEKQGQIIFQARGGQSFTDI